MDILQTLSQQEFYDLGKFMGWLNFRFTSSCDVDLSAFASVTKDDYFAFGRKMQWIM